MLEKMGWASGNGLGRKQNGEKSHVKIKKRKNNLGMYHTVNVILCKLKPSEQSIFGFNSCQNSYKKS